MGSLRNLFQIRNPFVYGKNSVKFFGFSFSMNIAEFLISIRDSFNGIESISITDRDGVEIFTSSKHEQSPKELQILSVIFALTHEQVSKFNFSIFTCLVSKT